MYDPVPDSDWEYETDHSCEEVLDENFKSRKGTDKDVFHTAMRAGYDEPLKGRVQLEVLHCNDGGELYRLTVDEEPLLHSDEEETGGWMTYDQLLCFVEGYRRLSDADNFVVDGE